MQFSWKSVGRVILLWLGLMVLVFIDAFFGREEITFFLIYGYALVTSFLVTKLVEKKEYTLKKITNTSHFNKRVDERKLLG